MSEAVSVSIIIPCRDDHQYLDELLNNITALLPLPEIIVSDSSRETQRVKEICNNYGVKMIQVHPPSRGQQLDLGAQKASCELLIFQHVDTDFSQDHYDSIIELFKSEPEIIGGAFLKDIDELYPCFRFFNWLHKIYTKYVGTLYGDQSVFVLKSVFFELGGFEGLPLMEDVKFSSKLRDYGSVRVIAPSIKTSHRKFIREGTLKRKLSNMWLIVLYRLGVSPIKLAAKYYSKKTSVSHSGQV